MLEVYKTIRVEIFQKEEMTIKLEQPDQPVLWRLAQVEDKAV